MEKSKQQITKKKKEKKTTKKVKSHYEIAKQNISHAFGDNFCLHLPLRRLLTGFGRSAGLPQSPT